MEQSSTFGAKFQKFIIILLIIFALFSFIIGIIFSANFLLQFSIDKSLKPETIAQIGPIKLIFLTISLIFFIMAFLSNYFKEKIILFSDKHNRIIKNLILLVLTVFVCLVIAEIALRLTLKNETYLYGFGPGAIQFGKDYVQLNSEGFRDREFSINKTPDTFRIAGIGDSFTLGYGIDNVSNTYLKVLERELKNYSNKKYEVYNFGISGYDTPQELDMIKNVSPKYHPDMIIIGYVLNDFVDADNNGTIDTKYVTLPYIGFWLRNVCYTYYFLETRTNKLLEILGYRPTYESTLVARYNSPTNIAYNYNLFGEIYNISKENNEKVVIVVFPMLYHFKNYPFMPAHNFVNSLHDKYGLEVIDLLNVYNKYPEKDLIISSYDTHPNEFADKLAADKIFEELSARKLLS